MIFQYTWPQVIHQQKTVTRRVIAASEDAVRTRYNKIAAITQHGRVKWCVGQTYAVQPRRGKKQVARVRITRITRERASRISTTSARAEGFASRQEFLQTWDVIHGAEKRAAFVWVIEFELVAISVPVHLFATQVTLPATTQA